MKKKITRIFLAVCLILTMTDSTALAKGSSTNNTEISIMSEDNAKAGMLLKENFSNSELKTLQSERADQDKIELQNGFTKKTTEVIVSSDKKFQNDPIGNLLQGQINIGDGIYYVDVVDTYTGKEEILNKHSKGMSYWLDVAWNLTIGSKTKYAWKAATILGINPSNYFSSYISGDKLSSTKTKVIRRRCYKKYNPIDNMDAWYFETRKVTIKNYVDLYTYDKNNNSVRKSSTDTANFYSKYYFNNSFIKKTVNEYCSTNVQVPYLDRIK